MRSESRTTIGLVQRVSVSQVCSEDGLSGGCTKPAGFSAAGCGDPCWGRVEAASARSSRMGVHHAAAAAWLVAGIGAGASGICTVPIG